MRLLITILPTCQLQSFTNSTTLIEANRFKVMTSTFLSRIGRASNNLLRMQPCPASISCRPKKAEQLLA